MGNKKMKSVSLSDEAIKKVGQAASQQKRSFSQMLEVIILNSKITK